MSEEIKFDPVFGPQELFDIAQDKHSFAIQTKHGIHFYISASSAIKSAIGMIDDGCINIAERRIIKTPAWTEKDKRAGRLPPIGSKYLAGGDRREFTCLFHSKGNGTVSVIGFNSDDEVSGYPIQYCHPIETPAEKAKREEDEWVNKAWSETAAFAEVTQDEHDRLRIHLRHIYRAQLSGELAAPKGGE